MSINNIGNSTSTYYDTKQNVKRFSDLTLNSDGSFSMKEEPLEGGFANLVDPEEFQNK